MPGSEVSRPSDRVTLLRAANPGPMTLEGTNTYLLAEPGATEAVLLDPGPALPEHLAAIEAAAAERDVRITTVVLTHGHGDHSEAAPELARRTGARVLAVDPAHRRGDEGLPDGSVLRVGGLELRVVATPGHSSDSVSLLLPAERAVLTGDTVLGRGTTVVAHPDGRLDDYLASLDRLGELAGDLAVLHPGHGPALDDPRAAVEYYRGHRHRRLAAVRAALDGIDATGAPVTALSVVAQVYSDVDPVLWPAAELSVRAQLEYLAVVEGRPAARAALDAPPAGARDDTHVARVDPSRLPAAPA
ncbi:MAG: beta-lactamase domain protein [Mycobacterium sp.]|nr:beta-lactamase domain protein [Mycobacterium sp.]